MTEVQPSGDIAISQIVAESRAQRREPTSMSGWLGHLDRLIVALDAEVLTEPGSVSHPRALDRAAAEYDKYKELRDAEPSPVERDYLADLRSTQKRLEGKPE